SLGQLLAKAASRHPLQRRYVGSKFIQYRRNFSDPVLGRSRRHSPSCSRPVSRQVPTQDLNLPPSDCKGAKQKECECNGTSHRSRNAPPLDPAADGANSLFGRLGCLGSSLKRQQLAQLLVFQSQLLVLLFHLATLLTDGSEIICDLAQLSA